MWSITAQRHPSQTALPSFPNSSPGWRLKSRSPTAHFLSSDSGKGQGSLGQGLEPLWESNTAGLQCWLWGDVKSRSTGALRSCSHIAGGAELWLKLLSPVGIQQHPTASTASPLRTGKPMGSPGTMAEQDEEGREPLAGEGAELLHIPGVRGCGIGC